MTPNPEDERDRKILDSDDVEVVVDADGEVSALLPADENGTRVRLDGTEGGSPPPKE